MPDHSVAELARDTGQCRKRISRLVRIPWLSPEIVKLILKGRQPASLTAARLMSWDIPADWAKQKQAFGILGAELRCPSRRPPAVEAGNSSS